MAIILGILGAVVGYMLAPRYIRGAQQIPAAIAGGVLGLLVGNFFGAIMGLLIPMLIGAALYLGYQRYKANQGVR
jgi:uncharacterized membrane protein YeaQ/YmgE (transglycosylase-associated protein family)